MASSSQHVAKLLLQVENGQALKDLKAEAIDHKAALDRLTQSYTAGEMTSDSYLKQSARLARELEKKEKVLREVERAERAASAAQVAAAAAVVNAADKTEAGVKAVEKGTRNMSQAALQGSYALQDLAQGGLGGILNNIAGVASGLGAGPGVAGLLTAVGVAALIAKPYLEQFFATGKIDPFKTAVEDATDRVEKLKEKVAEANASPLDIAVNRNQLAAAEADLARLTKAQEAFDALAGRKSKAERDSETTVAGLLDEAPGGIGVVRQRLKDAEIAKQMPKDAALAAARAELAGQEKRFAEGDDTQKIIIQEAIDKTKAEISALQGKVIAAAEQEVGKLFAPADAGKVGEQQAKLREKLRGVGMGGLADSLEANTPEMMKAQGASKAEFEKVTALRKARDADADMLTQQGREIEAQTKEKMAADAKAGREANAADKLKTDAERKAAAEARQLKIGGLLGGDDLEAQAENLFTQAGRAMPRRGQNKAQATAEAQAMVDEQIKRFTYQRLVGSGTEAGLAEDMANEAPGFYRNRAEDNRFKRIAQMGGAPGAFGGAGPNNFDPAAQAAAQRENQIGVGAGMRSVGVMAQATGKTLDVQGQTLSVVGKVAQVTAQMQAKVDAHQRVLGQISNVVDRTVSAQRRGRQ